MKNAFIQLLISAFKSVFFNKTLLLAVCFIVVFIIPNIVFAENFSPIVVQFTKKDYSAGNQNWSVAQDNNGFIYFGNNDGLLRYDGLNFKLIKLPNHQTIRSVYIDKNNRIYVGSFREFGYFESDEFGKLNYTSISSQLVDYNMENDEIWKIIEFENKVFFQSFKSIFIFDGKTIKGKSYDQSFLYFFAFQNQLYLHTLRDGFSKFDYKTNQFEVLQNVPFKSSVISIVPFSKNKAYVITQNDGIFIFNGNSYTHFGDNNLDFLKKVGTNNGVLSKDSLLIVGTITDGVVAIDKFGKKKWHLNTSNNLQNNTILGLYCDNENNLWAALDKGFAMVRLNSPLQFIQNFTSSIGAIYSVNLQPISHLL